jgi:hypothetical protein
MSKWECKRCGLVVADAELPIKCSLGPCPMEEIQPSVLKRVIAVLLLLLMLPFACINYTIGTVCMSLDDKMDRLYDRVYKWSQK